MRPYSESGIWVQMTHFATAEEFPVVSENEHEAQQWGGAGGQLQESSGGALRSPGEGVGRRPQK